jgi:DNA-binding NtrC family response regulator
MFILIITSRLAQFAEFMNVFTDNGVDVGQAITARAALVHAKIDPPALVVVDEVLPDASSFDFVAKLKQINPAIPAAVVSQLGPTAFYEAGKGLNTLTALPLHPKATDAIDLLAALSKKPYPCTGKPINNRRATDL